MPATQARSPFRLPQHALVTDAQGELLAIEEFEERDGELPRQARELLERLRIDRSVLRKVREHAAAELQERRGAEPEILADFAGAARAGERLEQGLGALRRLADQARQLVGTGRREARAFQDAGELLLRVRVRPRQPGRRPRRMDALRVRPQLAALGQLRQRLREQLLGRRTGALAQLLAAMLGSIESR